jgi:hypothetical protein
VVEDAIYPLKITFEKGAAPPVNAFWSITLYDQDGFQVGNDSRSAVGCPSSTMPMARLTSISKTRIPERTLEANWLPAPKAPFNLTMRLYAPKSEALTGKWNPPPVTRAQGLPSLIAQ